MSKYLLLTSRGSGRRSRAISFNIPRKERSPLKWGSSIAWTAKNDLFEESESRCRRTSLLLGAR
jgi:hypothetical protein